MKLMLANADLGLLELGSNSAKFHKVLADSSGTRRIETAKVPWKISYRVYRDDDSGTGCIDEIVDSIRKLGGDLGGADFARVFCVATGVFRDMVELERVENEVLERTGVRIRLLSGDDEARLMAMGLRRLGVPPPVLTCDLGGSSMEWAFRDQMGKTQFGSINVGAIRTTVAWPDGYKEPDRFLAVGTEYCIEEMRGLRGLNPHSCLFTGGTAKAIAAIAGDREHGQPDVVPRSALDRLLADTLANGPSEELKPERREIFVAGLLVVQQVMEQSGAATLIHRTDAVRGGLVLRLLRLLEERQVQELETRELIEPASNASMSESVEGGGR